jgi:hypothetical protein
MQTQNEPILLRSLALEQKFERSQSRYRHHAIDSRFTGSNGLTILLLSHALALRRN